MKKLGLTLIVFFIFCTKSLAHDSYSEVDQLKKEIKRLDTVIQRLSTKVFKQEEKVKPFLSQSLSFGGFFENSAHSIWGPNTPSQIVADRHKLGINLSAELAPQFHLVSQFTLALNYAFRNPHNNPNHNIANLPTSRSYSDIVFGALLSQVFLEYKSRPWFNIQSGIGYVPFGKAFQVRDPVLFRRQLGPQFIRTNGINSVIIAHPFWEGLHIYGSISKNWNYNIYTLSSLDHSGKMGLGTRLWWQASPWLTLGASTQNAQRQGASYFAYGADADFNFNSFGFLTEYGRNESPLAHLTSYYGQLYFRFLSKKLTLHFDADYLNNLLGTTSFGSLSVSDPYVKWEYGTGINYQVLPNVKLRMIYLVHDYTGITSNPNGQNRDYNSIGLSTGVSF